jgi:hypothetical protein
MNRTELARVWPPNHNVASRAGHKPMSPVEAIRRKCLDCSGGQVTEVKLCETVTCALWQFRAGRHLYTRRGLLEAISDSRALDSCGCYFSLAPLQQQRARSAFGAALRA